MSYVHNGMTFFLCSQHQLQCDDVSKQKQNKINLFSFFLEVKL